MERRIFKYSIKIADEQIVKMPFGAKILDIQKHGIGWCLWALVDPAQDMHDYKIEIIGTGNPADVRKRDYITTVQDAPFVWHFFLNH